MILGDISGFLGGFLVNLLTVIARQLSDMYIQNVVAHIKNLCYDCAEKNVKYFTLKLSQKKKCANCVNRPLREFWFS